MRPAFNGALQEPLALGMRRTLLVITRAVMGLTKKQAAWSSFVLLARERPGERERGVLAPVAGSVVRHGHAAFIVVTACRVAMPTPSNPGVAGEDGLMPYFPVMKIRSEGLITCEHADKHMTPCRLGSASYQGEGLAARISR
jgi:hypothetical protein